MIITIGIHNDIHAGSKEALTPWIDRGSNSFQKWILPEWKREAINNSPLDIGIILGDPIEGPAPGHQEDLITTSVETQLDMFEELYSMWVDNKTEIHLLGSSGHHRGKGTGFNSDKELVTLLKERGFKAKYHKGAFGLDLTQWGIKRNLQFLHKSKSLTRELSIIYENYFHADIPKVTDVFVGHSHEELGYKKGKLSLQHCAGWKYQMDFCGFGYTSKIPSIGWTKVEIDTEKKTVITTPIGLDIPSRVHKDMDEWLSLSNDRLQEFEEIKAERRLLLLPPITQEVVIKESHRLNNLQCRGKLIPKAKRVLLPR